jgi:putative peptidoglycan lipid II flippase
MRAAAKTAAMMAVLTLGMKVLGFLREVFMAGFFGTSYIVDAYVMASAIPGILFAGIFTSVAVSYMPIFSRIVEDKGMEGGNRFTSEAITLTSFIALISAALGIIFSEQVVKRFGQRFCRRNGHTDGFLSSDYFFVPNLYRRHKPAGVIPAI